MSAAKQSYAYVHRDLLDGPEYYMYSPYGGQAFLRKYLSSRVQYAARFEARYMQQLHAGLSERVSGDRIGRMLSMWRPLLNNAHGLLTPEANALHDTYSERVEAVEDPSESDPVSISKLDALSEIPTERVLRALLSASLGQGGRDGDILYRWLSRFLSRFEVTKKLYTVYTSRMRPASQEFRVLTTYALLSLCLILYYDDTENLKMVNGALKLNDVLCSNASRLDQTEDLLLTFISLRMEVGSVRQLGDGHKVVFN